MKTLDPYVKKATGAMHEVFGKETVFVRGGGSIPIVGDFIRELGIPTLLIFKNGELADQIVGLAPKEEIAKKLDQQL